MKKYSVGDIAKQMNVSADAIRYYDKEGLLPFAKRDDAGRRQFTDDDLGYIEVINCLKMSGIKIKEIGKFIDWCMEGDSTLDKRLAFMEDQESQLEQQIKVLETNLAFLRWKKWYYQSAAEAGTESIHFMPGTTQVDAKVHERYQKELAKQTSNIDQ